MPWKMDIGKSNIFGNEPMIAFRVTLILVFACLAGCQTELEQPLLLTVDGIPLVFPSGTQITRHAEFGVETQEGLATVSVPQSCCQSIIVTAVTKGGKLTTGQNVNTWDQVESVMVAGRNFESWQQNILERGILKKRFRFETETSNSGTICFIFLCDPAVTVDDVIIELASYFARSNGTG